MHSLPIPKITFPAVIYLISFNKVSFNKVPNYTTTSTKSAVSASRWVEGINELLDGKEQFQTRTEKLIPELRNLRDEEIDDVYRYMSKQPWNLDQKVQHFSNLFPQKERNTKIY